MKRRDFIRGAGLLLGAAFIPKFLVPSVPKLVPIRLISDLHVEEVILSGSILKVGPYEKAIRVKYQPQETFYAI